MKVANDIKAATGVIELTGNCDDKCDEAWSRINSIEIEQIPEKVEAPALEEESAKTVGCNSKINGHCDDLKDDNLHNCFWKSFKDNMEKVL